MKADLMIQTEFRSCNAPGNQGRGIESITTMPQTTAPPSKTWPQKG